MPRGSPNGRSNLEPIIRTSTTQPQLLGPNRRRNNDWDASSPICERVRKEYDAIVDPYCPYTQTSTFKKHMDKRQKLEKIPVEKMSKSQTMDLQTSMKNMARPISAPQRERVPKHQVENQHFQDSGVTISAEPRGHSAESQAELEILKAILNRESYLVRLNKAVKKVERKFKPEVATVLDLVRSATTEVVDAIVKWRSIKNDPDCAFMWNGINYLLKIPTDMDYIGQYRAITDWLGFGIIRNPFCVPYPMEEGAELFPGTAQDPSDLTGMSASTSDELANTGSMAFSTSSKLRSKFPRGGMSRRGGMDSTTTPGIRSPNRARRGESLSLIQSAQNTSESTNIELMQGLGPNREMARIRCAERVILLEEEKYGRLDRDPQGRIVPEDQAYMKHLALSLKKDERRTMADKAASKRTFAPHVERSGIGFAEPPWFPEEDEEEDDDNEKDLREPEGVSDKHTITRNKERLGGALSQITTACGSSRTRKPQHPNPSNEIEFKNSRKKQAVLDRLKQVLSLKEKIFREKCLLEKDETKSGEWNGVKAIKARKSRVKGRMTKIAEQSVVSETDTMSAEEKESLLGNLLQEEDILAVELKKTADHESHIHKLKAIHREAEVKERSREIERKRRLLNEEEAKRRGPPDEEPFNAYDYYATRAQTQVRKWLAQRFVKWFRKEANVASRIIQTRIRGMCARLRCKRLLKQRFAAIEIQRNFRGMASRLASAAMARDYHDAKAAIQIQKIWRRIMALKRVETKRVLDNCAADAMVCVSAKNLFPMDVKELSHRIQLALNEPHANSLPPDEVLHLLRISSVLVLAGEGSAGITTYDHIGSRYHVETDGRNLSWEQAMKLINRSNKYLRRVRALAYAPIAKPPRLINLPEDVVALYKAQARNPKWCLSFFESIGRGSKFCVQLFKWLESMIRVGQAQTKFFDFIGDNFPDWLPKLFEVQKKSRKCEFDIALNEHCISCLQKIIDDNPNNENLHSILEAEKQSLSRENEGLRQKLKSYTKRERIIGEDQNSVEAMTLKAMTTKLREKEDNLKVCAREYLDLVKATEEGNTIAESKLQSTQENLTTLRLEVQEARIQHGLLISQIESNQERRRERKPLSEEVLVRVNFAGEAKAVLAHATAKKAVLLMDRGIRSEDGLHRQPDAAAMYDDLCVQERARKNEFRALLRQADEELQDLNFAITSEVFQREEDEKSERARFIPTEEEMEEERLEDDNEARAERFAKQMFVSHEVIYDAPERLRPVIVAFGRDVPGYTKAKIISDITAQLPGMFVQLDCDSNMGLDLKEMQSVFDAKKSIIMSVDHGLTQTTRIDFIKNYSMIVRCLVPKPYTVFVIGEDGNMRKPTGDPRYGVSGNDIQRMYDAPIKLSLEKMSWILQELVTKDIRKRMESRASMIVPPSPAYIVCLEALFILQSDHTRFRQPGDRIAAISYRATQALIQDPYGLVNILRQIKRGKADYMLCELLKSYIEHRSWPFSSHPERKSDPLLNLLAMYVEEWTSCEMLTLQRGGVPDSSLFKNSMEKVQCIVSLADVTDANDELEVKRRCGWKTPMTQILKGILYEMRVVKVVRRIDNQMYSINVYREAGRIFFDAYDATTSQSYVTSISLLDIPPLLQPNTQGKESDLISPPDTPKEMYLRLVKLLRFEKSVKLRSGRKELLCRRDIKFLSQQITKICGHFVILKCFEAALGELYLEAYLPEYCAKLTLQVGDSLRLRMLANCDHQLEYYMLETNHSVDLLPYVLDRLRIAPTKPSAASRREKPTGITALSKRTAHQGFALLVNCKAGAGRFLTKKIISFANLPYILAIRSSSVSQTLRIIAYEPRTQATTECRMTKFLRVVLLGAVNDDYKVWFPKLAKILRLDWKNNRQLIVDKTLYRTVRRISKRRLILTFSLTDENGLAFDFHDPVTGDHFYAVVKKNHIIDLLHYDQSEILGEKKHKKSSGMNLVKDMLRYMLGERRKANKHAPKELHPSEYDIPLENILSQKECLIHLANQMQELVELVNPKDRSSGYLCRFPSRIVFERTCSDGNNKSKSYIEDDDESVITRASSIASGRLPPCSVFEPASPEEDETKVPKLDIALRHSCRLIQQERGGSLEDLIARRRQAKVVMLEDELNSLAKSQVAAAEEKVLADKILADELARSLALEGIDLTGANESMQRAGSPSAIDSDKDNIVTDTLESSEFSNVPEGTTPSVRPSEQPSSADIAESNDPPVPDGTPTTEEPTAAEVPLSSDQEVDGSRNMPDTHMDEPQSPVQPTPAEVPNPLDQPTPVEVPVSSDQTSPVDEPNSQPDPVTEPVYPRDRDLQKSSEPELDEDGLVIVDYDDDNSVRDNVHTDTVEEHEEEDVNPVVLPSVDQFAALITVNDIISRIEKRNSERDIERNAPGTVQKKFLESLKSRSPLYASLKADEKVYKEILIGTEKCVFDQTVKTNFREGTSRWHGRVAVTAFESACWDGAEGVGRRFRFVVHESKTSCDYEGFIRATKHLREVLGPTAQDLLPMEKTTEMMIFLCRHRLELVKNITSDGAPVGDPMAPTYLVEFMTGGLHVSEKDTPNAGSTKGEKTKKDKLIDNAQARGKKILRVAKRISGLLLQLVVFELPADGVDQEKMTEEEELMKKVLEDEESAKQSKVSKPQLRSQLTKRTSMELLLAPSVRIVGYDPRTKKRSVLIIPPEAVTELAGGAYSHFLKLERRRDLGRIICEALQLKFQRGGGFDLVIPWSRQAKLVNTPNGKNSWMSSVSEQILQRPGKIFRAAVSVSNYDIVVSVYALGIGPGGILGSDKTIAVTFTSSTVSEPVEITMSESVQVEYLGQTVMSFLPGETRSTAIQNMCKYFRAKIYEDPGDSSKKVLDVELLPKQKGFISDYKNIGLPRPEDDIRAVGVPQVFMPPDATGKILFRRSTQVYMEDKNALSDVEFVVSIYTKSEKEGPERGVVAKVYDPGISQTVVLHYGHNEISRLCDEANEPDLLKNIVSAREYVTDGPQDELEEGFITLTEKGEILEEINKHTSVLCDIVIKDMGLTTNSQGERSLYSRTSNFEPK